jgi:hypothetical protein
MRNTHRTCCASVAAVILLACAACSPEPGGKPRDDNSGPRDGRQPGSVTQPAPENPGAPNGRTTPEAP